MKILIVSLTALTLTACSESKYVERNVCTEASLKQIQEYSANCLKAGNSSYQCKIAATALFCPVKFIKNPNYKKD